MMKKIVDILPNRSECCILIKSAFSKEFCDNILNEKEEFFKKASTHYPISYRNNDRQVLDDIELSRYLFSKIKKFIPRKISVKAISEEEKGEWNLKELNSRIRICRYLPNQYFNKHLDGVHYKSKNEQSKLTFMIYLNSSDEFEGGRTLFFESKENDKIIANYKPVKGDLIIFDHNIWHSGEEVISGVKYVLRSDIIYYKKEDNINEIPFREGHLGYIWQAINFNDKLITSGRDKKIKVWDLFGNKLSETIAHNNSIVTLIKLNEETLVSGSRDASVKIWRINKCFKLSELKVLDNHKATILALCKIKDNEFLCVDASGNIFHYNTKGLLIKRFKGHHDWIWSIIKITEKVFVTVSEDGTMVFWDVITGKSIIRWEGINVPINSVSFDGVDCVYIGLFDGNIIKFSFNIEKQELHKIIERKCHQGTVRNLVFEREKLFSVAEDKKLFVLDSKSLSQIYEYEHNNFAQDVVLFENAFFSVSYDGKIIEHKRQELF